MKGITFDPETQIVSEHYALIYAPGRSRDRFPENCVTVVASEEVAVGGANPAKNLYAAKVIGPSRSSEGLRLYYLVCWLAQGK